MKNKKILSIFFISLFFSLQTIAYPPYCQSSSRSSSYKNVDPWETSLYDDVSGFVLDLGKFVLKISASAYKSAKNSYYNRGAKAPDLNNININGDTTTSQK